MIEFLLQQGQGTDPWPVKIDDIIPEGTDPNANQDGTQGGGSMAVQGDVRRTCRPKFNLMGDNSAWFVFTGVEVALIVLILIGILAVLFGNPEKNEQIVQVAEVAAVA